MSLESDLNKDQKIRDLESEIESLRCQLWESEAENDNLKKWSYMNIVCPIAVGVAFFFACMVFRSLIYG